MTDGTIVVLVPSSRPALPSVATRGHSGAGMSELSDDTRMPTPWYERVPPVLLPIPAADAGSLPGCRVVVHDPRHGVWLYDQRAATPPHPYRGDRMVGVLDESDWYRRRRDPETAAAIPHPVPLSRVWVERPVELGVAGGPDRDEQTDLPAETRARSVISDCSRPPVRWLRWAPQEQEITGARVWVTSPDGLLRGLRACGEPRRTVYEGTLNMTRGVESLDEPVTGTAVPVCDEAEWYLWRQTGDAPTPTLMATQFVWVE